MIGTGRRVRERRALDPLSDWPCDPPPGYRGQLRPEFQAARSASYQRIGLAECDWYHSTTLPDGSFAQGEWDLRGREPAYLGHPELKGRSVLEIGPASGYLTFWMEDQGAEVTAFEAGYDAAIDVLPGVLGDDGRRTVAEVMDHTRRTVNAWWYLHRARGSGARLVHGDLYRLPDDLGRYDVATFGCVLVHLRDPYEALRQAARFTDRTIIVTEQLDEVLLGERIVRFGPDVEDPAPSVMWWRFSPTAVAAMLWRLGFTRSHVVLHSQRHHLWSVEYGRLGEYPMFTVVADREAGLSEGEAMARLEEVPIVDERSEAEAVRSAEQVEPSRR